MAILHILRSPPDTAIEKLLSELSTDEPSRVIKLYEGGIDWDGVVDASFI